LSPDVSEAALDKFLTLVISGAVTGAIYSLVASGLTLSYAATGIFNFSYGGVAFSSAYLYYELHTALHWSIGVAGIVTVFVFAPLLGLLLDVAVFRPLSRASESAKIVATVGLLLALPALTELITDGVINIFGTSLARSTTVLQVGFPPGLGPVPAKTWHLPGGIPLTSNGLVVFCCAVICALLLWVLLRKTALGLRMRAVVDRPALARTRGIDEVRTSRYAWVIGTVLAALAGVAGAPILGVIGTAPFLAVTFVASAAVVLGGMTSIPLAFAGGLLLGIVQNLVAGYASFASAITGFNDSVPTVLLLVALIALGRDKSRRAGSVTEESPPPDYLSHLPRWRQAAPWAVASVFLVVFIEFLASDFWAGIMAQGLALSLIFLSFVVVTGMGGMVSLAQATFVTTAGLTTGLLFQQYHVPFFAAALIAIVITVLLGLVVALPALRLGGLSLALATLALAILCDNVLFQWDWLRNHASGWTIPRPKLGPLDLTNNRTMALSLFVLSLIVMLLINNIKRSAWGRSIAAVRSTEAGAATSGISALRVKLVLFSLSAAIAGLGGIMYASYQSSVSSDTTPYINGLLWLATVVLFGVRRPAAAIFAGVVTAATPVILSSGFHWWSWVPTWLSWGGTQSSEIPLILFGLGAVTLARDPDGFIAAFAERRHDARMRKGKKAIAVPVQSSPNTWAASSFDQRAANATALTLASASDDVSSGPTVDPAVDQRTGLLVLDQVWAGYGAVEVLHGVSLVVPAGAISVLLGANGSGKSTLCSVISGLVPNSRGRVLLDGVDISRLAAHRRVGRSMLVAPESRGIFPSLTVDENLALRLDEQSREEVYAQFPSLRERYRLTAGSLSGGEQQMLTLAPLVVKPPRLVVADEPSLGLAPLVVGQLMDLFRTLRDRGSGVLLVEEKARDVLEVADHVAFIELGKVVWTGPRQAVDDEQLIGAYLGSSR
jgi:ABC-type branched-subunit amino acid transport system ATPase component/branched-subunit amino acid ABC-type transport system permease component